MTQSQWQAAGQLGCQGTAEVLELLATLSSPEEILALRPSSALQSRVQTLLQKKPVNDHIPVLLRRQV